MAIIRQNCPHCPAEHVAFQVVFSEAVPNMHLLWNSLARCAACNQPICFTAVASSPHTTIPPTQYAGDIEQAWTLLGVWPTKIAFDAPPHTPPTVAKRFLEGEDGFKRRNWNSAVAMYRSALDIATKAMEGVPKGDFFNRLKWLNDNNKITPDIWQWATHVRVEGNAALHDPEEFDEKDAKSLRFFTEMFLRCVFELPGAVKEFRERSEKEN